MKTISQKKSNCLTFNLLLFVAFSLLFNFYSNLSYPQLSEYLINQNDDQSLYNIKAGMVIYLDSLVLIQDSTTFYAEGGEYREYMKFINYWEPILHPHGDITKLFDVDSIYYNNTLNNYSYFSEEPWHELGPLDNTFGIGPVEYLSIFDDGTSESTRYMLVASMLGGVFYSTDYGDNWNSTATDTQWELSGSGCAVFHPRDHKTWFASTSGNSNGSLSLWLGKTGGIWRTNDEGQNWHKIANHLDLGGIWTKINKLHILEGDPHILFAATSDGIYKSENFETSNPSWEKVMDGLAFDIESKPGNNSTIYATAFRNDSAWKVLKSDNVGDATTWVELNQQPELVLSPALTHSSYTIEVSKANPDRLYCLVNNSYAANLYYCDFSDSIYWKRINSQTFTMNFGQGHGFGVEQIDSGENLFVSFEKKMKKFNTSISDTGQTKYPNRVDVEDVVYHPYYEGEIWACTHGGVEKSIDGGDNWIPKYTGLGVANVEDIATSITNPEKILIGLYHDGTQLTVTPYDENWMPDWDWVMKGDGMRPLIDPKDPNKVWASAERGKWLFSNDYFSQHELDLTMPTRFATEGVLNKVTPSKMYRHAFYNYPDGESPEVFVTEEGENQIISSFHAQFPNGYFIIGLYTPYTNADYLLVTIKDESTGDFFLFRSTNATDTQNIEFKELIIPRHNGGIATIDFDPLDEQIVYIVYTNTTGNGDFSTDMVYRINYTDTQNPVVENLSRNLPNTTTLKDCLEIDKGSYRGIYLFTQYGMFYTNNDLLAEGFDCWRKLGKGLPHTRGGNLEINYACNKLRAGLFGRGVWEFPLADMPGLDSLDGILQEEPIDEKQFAFVHPNPCSYETIFSINLPVPVLVKISIFDQFGRQVDFLQQKQTQGKQQIVWNAERFPSGMYYFTLKAGEQMASGKMVVVR